MPDKTGHARGIAHHIPGFFRQDHIHQDVAREDPALDRAALAFFDFDFFFGGDDDIKDLVLHPHAFDALFQVMAHFILVTRIAVHHIPGATIFARSR